MKKNMSYEYLILEVRIIKFPQNQNSCFEKSYEIGAEVQEQGILLISSFVWRNRIFNQL